MNLRRGAGWEPNHFINGILNKPCRVCGCQITKLNSRCVNRSIESRCKDCYDKHLQNWKMSNYYGITLKEYEDMLIKQNNKCAICDNSNEDKRLLGIDHNHNTNKVRELLCQRCNMLIGNCNEDINLLYKMINYLIKHTNIEKEFSFQHE